MARIRIPKGVLYVASGLFIACFLFFIHMFVFTFTTVHPNFSDVERVFNRIQFPSDWVEIDSSENRGLQGRRCEIEPESACFHKSKTFKIEQDVPLDELKAVLKKAGCNGFQESDNTKAHNSANLDISLSCGIEGLRVGADYDQGEKISVSVTTP